MNLGFELGAKSGALLKLLGAASVALSSLMLSACGADETPSYRYRLTVEVETPEGLKSGSSVLEVETSVASQTSIPTPGAVSHRLRGEAVAVDLGDRGTLFALMRSEVDADWAVDVMFMLAPDPPRGSEDPFLARYSQMLAMKQPIDLPKKFSSGEGMPARPMLVTFGDISDPKTVERVDPDDLAATFGAGVKLDRITVQMTDDPVETGIVNRLPWLRVIRQGMLDGNRIEDFRNPALAAHISPSSFSTEVD